ncbi:MAG: HTTM domain-containing protein [Planctomycetota bacterium]
MISIYTVVEAWNWFFHEPQYLFPLALFRMLFGALVVCNAVLVLGDTKKYLCVDSVLDFKNFESLYGRKRFNLFNLLPKTDSSVYWVLCLNGVSGFTLAAGCCTQISAFICFVTLVSIHHRNPAILHGGDTLMRAMSFLLIFSPAGLGWSLDAWFEGAWEATADPWCLRLMQIQVSIIYLRTVFWKLRGSKWRNGTAVWYPAQSEIYRRFKLPSFFLNKWNLRIATWSTLFVEFSLGSLIWISEFRYFVIGLGVALHLSIEYAMNFQLFGFLMIACLMLFL